MTRQPQCWFFLVDEGRGRLLSGQPVPAGKFHLEEVESIDNRWEEHQHQHPSARVGREGHAYASPGHEPEEMMRRDAKDMAEWLEARLEKHGIERVHVFAPPRFLGVLRDQFSPHVRERVEEHHGDLVPVEMVGLMHHPAILEVLGVTSEA